MNPLIDLLDQALQANLSKRQWAAFAAVLRQTLGFRKVEDDLSARRLEQLTGIQRNHIWQAKRELEALGLLHSRSGQYGEILAFPMLIKDSAATVQTAVMSPKTETDSPPIPPPLTPETGQIAPKTGQPVAQIGTDSLPKQDITRNNLTSDNHYTVHAAAESVLDADAATLQYPSELSAREREQAPVCLDGLSPQAAQQVLDVWAYKIRHGEVRKSRIGFLLALIKAQRQGSLDTRCLQLSHPASPPDPASRQQLQARELWLEQQAQQAWLRDMQHFGITVNDLSLPARYASGGGT